MEVYSSESPNYIKSVELKLKNFVDYKGYRFNITENQQVVEECGMMWGNLLGHKVKDSASMLEYLVAFEKFLGSDKFINTLKAYVPLQQRKAEWNKRKSLFTELKSIDGLSNCIYEDMMSILFGNPYKIDVVYLDKALRVPKDTSTSDFITTNFGIEIANKIRSLI